MTGEHDELDDPMATMAAAICIGLLVGAGLLALIVVAIQWVRAGLVING
jgi:hypothetical protein